MEAGKVKGRRWTVVGNLGEVPFSGSNNHETRNQIAYLDLSNLNRFSFVQNVDSLKPGNE